MNHTAHHPHVHRSYHPPPPPSMYGATGSGPAVPQQGMPPAPLSHAAPHQVHHSHSHPHHHMPPPPPQTNGIANGPSPRIVPGAPIPLSDGPPQRSSSAAGHQSHHHHHHHHPQSQQHLHRAPIEIAGGPGQPMSIVQKLAHANEQTFIAIGSAAEAMEDFDRAIAAYESALRHNPYSVPAMNAIAGVHRTMDRFEKAVDYFQRVLNIVPENGETWGAMGHCYLMMDDLQKAYTAYQQALYHLPNPKEPKLWYGIGILYDRYGSLEHAEEAFASVVRMDPNYEKANEIYFRLGIIYKQQNKYQASLECFRYILNNPPRPLTEIDVWFQIGHVYEQQKEFGLAKEAYERVLTENPNHAKVLQQLGWLYHTSNAGFENQEQAIQLLTKSLESDANDSQSWYLLGRAYMAEQNYNKAYEAYQQAVYRDGKNPSFWCSIGVLYFQINQYRDALDAFSRAIRLNPYISEVWFDLGSLYEACNNQFSDAIDAYSRAAELDPENPHMQQRLILLRNAEAKGEQVSSAPTPQDVNPAAYANHAGIGHGPLSAMGSSSGLAPTSYASGGPPFPISDGPSGRELPGPGLLRRSRSPGDSSHRPPVIPNIDDRGTKPSSHAQLGPMHAPRGGHSPPHHTSGPHQQERRSPGVGNRRQYEREKDREMDWERERRRDRMYPHAPPPGPQPNGRGALYQREQEPENTFYPAGNYEGGAYPSHYHQGEDGPALRPPTGPLPGPDTEGGSAKSKKAIASSSTVSARAISGASKKNVKEESSYDSSSPRRKPGSGPSRGLAGSSTPRGSSPAISKATGTPSSTRKNQASKKGRSEAEPARVPSPADSDSSSGSNRPLAAGSSGRGAGASQAPSSRVVDEDYDEGAADALMGLAGAASASSSLPAKGEVERSDSVKDTSEQQTKSQERSSSQEHDEKADEKEREASQRNREKVSEVQARAEAAAAAEEEDVRSGAFKSLLGKRTAEANGDEEVAEKKVKGNEELKEEEPVSQQETVQATGEDVPKDDGPASAGYEEGGDGQDLSEDAAENRDAYQVMVEAEVPEDKKTDTPAVAQEKKIVEEQVGGEDVKEEQDAASEPEEGEVADDASPNEGKDPRDAAAKKDDARSS